MALTLLFIYAISLVVAILASVRLFSKGDSILAAIFASICPVLNTFVAWLYVTEKR